MKPRVLIVIDTYRIGGPGKGLLQFFRNGGLECCQPLLVSFWRGPEGDWQFRDAAQATGVSFQALKQRHGFDPAVLKGLLRLARDNDIQIIQSHGYKAHLLCFFLSRLTGLPWVGFVHGWTSENLKVKCYNLIDKLMVRFADRIVPVSASLGERLHLGTRGRSKMQVVNNAVDLTSSAASGAQIRQRFGIADSDFLLGVVGRLSPEKGHADFIAAMKRVADSAPRVKAIFIGDGQERSALERSIAEHSLQQRIFLAGYQEELAPYYRALDLVVMPSHSEGMPNAALEAMVHGKPVLATAVGGIPEVVLDGVTGVLVPPHDPAALSAAVLKLAQDRGLLDSLGSAGEERVKSEFNPLERTRKIVALYRELLAPRYTAAARIP